MFFIFVVCCCCDVFDLFWCFLKSVFIIITPLNQLVLNLLVEFNSLGASCENTGYTFLF